MSFQLVPDPLKEQTLKVCTHMALLHMPAGYRIHFILSLVAGCCKE